MNLASGNLLVRNSDVEIAGTGLDLNVGRSYNSLSAIDGSLGRGWSMDTGEDVRIYDEQDGSVTLQGPSGYLVRFPIRTDGSFDSPPGLRATLRRPTGTTFELTDNPTGERLHFTSAGRNSWGRLTARSDRYGNRLSFAYDGNGLASITDTQGRVIAVAHDAVGRTVRLTDPPGRNVRYGYDAQGRLDSLVDAGDQLTRYGYDGSNRLASITTPAGRVTRG